MKHIIKTILSVIGTGVIAIFLMGILASSAFAAPVTPTYGGGLGTSTLPAFGSIPCGVTSSQYGILAAGTNSQVLQASSSAPCGVSWGTLPAGTVGPATTTYVAVFNAAGTVIGYANLTYTSSSNVLNVGGAISINSGNVLEFNGSPVTDAGGDWTSNVIQSSGANVIVQAPTGTASLGNLVQNGGVEYYNTTTTISGAQFCGGGLVYVANTTSSITIALPATSTMASSPCASSIYAGAFAQQYLVNNSTNTVFSTITGSGEQQDYAPGTPTSLAPGQEWFITGQFENSSTVQGATSTGTLFVAKYLLEQTSTPLIVSGNAVTFSQVKNALHLGDANGNLTAYAGTGTPCIGQPIQGITATGTAICGNAVVSIAGGSGTLGLTAPLQLTGGNINIAASGVASGTYTNANITVSSSGLISLASNGSAGGGGGAGNLFVTPTSSVLANNVAVFQTAASSTIKATSSIYSFADGGVSINTSTENGLLNAVNSNGIVAARFSTSTLNATSVSLSVLGASSTAASNFSVFQVLADGHINSTGTIPTVSSCGSGAAVIGTDSGGTVSIGSGVVTACTLTFQIPYETSNLFVLESDNSTAVTGDVTSVSNTAVTFGFSATLGGGKLYYFVGENL